MFVPVRNEYLGQLCRESQLSWTFIYCQYAFMLMFADQSFVYFITGSTKKGAKKTGAKKAVKRAGKKK